MKKYSLALFLVFTFYDLYSADSGSKRKKSPLPKKQEESLVELYHYFSHARALKARIEAEKANAVSLTVVSSGNVTVVGKK